MYSLAFLACAAFLLWLLLTPAIRVLSRQWGVVDVPASDRIIHESPDSPRRGIAIAIYHVLACRRKAKLPGRR
jgi:UDP-N-acetylmuramyl pentapeptide phosphotransferase/UDP-N-acetylglucosamine-1-phosphate transferase